jgi:hypothetical protein
MCALILFSSSVIHNLTSTPSRNTLQLPINSTTTAGSNDHIQYARAHTRTHTQYALHTLMYVFTILTYASCNSQIYRQINIDEYSYRYIDGSQPNSRHHSSHQRSSHNQHGKWLLFVCRCDQLGIAFTDSQETHYTKFHGNPSSGTQDVPCGSTDRQT